MAYQFLLNIKVILEIINNITPKNSFSFIKNLIATETLNLLRNSIQTWIFMNTWALTLHGRVPISLPGFSSDSQGITSEEALLGLGPAARHLSEVWDLIWSDSSLIFRGLYNFCLMKISVRAVWTRDTVVGPLDPGSGCTLPTLVGGCGPPGQISAGGPTNSLVAWHWRLTLKHGPQTWVSPGFDYWVLCAKSKSKTK